MTREKLEQWLDRQIELRREFMLTRSLLDDEENEYTCRLDGYTDGIHITHSKAIARLLELTMELKELSDVEYPYKIIFRYKGVMFFSLYTKEDFINE